MRASIAAVSLLALAIAAGGTAAEDVFMYPAKGQSQEQQDKDRYECHRWAVQQTGFDPSQAQQAAPAPAPAPPTAGTSSPPASGQVLRGAGRGAAVGAIGGAIGGDAGKGAAIGAATGGAIGALRRRDQRIANEQAAAEQQRQATQAQSQQASAAASQRNAYQRALGACLQGRGYTVN
jgi:hypothetical protein